MNNISQPLKLSKISPKMGEMAFLKLFLHLIFMLWDSMKYFLSAAGILWVVVNLVSSFLTFLLLFQKRMECP